MQNIRAAEVTMIGFSFHEVMEGKLELGDRVLRPLSFSLDVRFPELADVATSAVGEASGTLRIDGVASDVRATGTIELAPFGKRRVRYSLRFRGDGGQDYVLTAEKTIGGLLFNRGWTEMPGELREASGPVVGTTLIRFSRRRHLLGLLSSMRLTGLGRRTAATAS
jgi:hypothetical protein